MNKSLKAHTYEESEMLSNFLDHKDQRKLINLLNFHLKDFTDKKSTDDTINLYRKLYIHFRVNPKEGLNNWLDRGTPKLKEVFLLIELILETYVHCNRTWLPNEYLLDFVDDVNDFFLINKMPFHLRYSNLKKEFFVEKIISPEVSEEIKKTLENFSGQEKVFKDFKEAIKSYSSGDYERAIEKCCISIEDYLCVILDKQTCQSVDAYYKEVSKKFNISADLDNRFSNIVSFIHKYRSHQNHGAIEKKEIPEPELTTQVVIQFTMIILNYLKKKKEEIK